MKDNKPQTTPLHVLIAATEPYLVEVAGNSLAPRVHDGDHIPMKPAINHPDAMMPNTVVLVALENPRYPGCFDRPSLLFCNADGDLQADNRIIEKGHYILLGVEFHPE